MKTELSVINDHQSVMIKRATVAHDRKVLRNIKKNLEYVNNNYPSIEQSILVSNKNYLVINFLNGTSCTSKDAVNYYSNNEWVIKGIVDKIQLFEAQKHKNIQSIKKFMVLCKPIMRCIYYGGEIIPDVFLSTLRLLFSKKKWVDSHGDFTVYNILIDPTNKSVKIIDWESFGVRPKYYDLLMLIYDQCCYVNQLTWQNIVAEEYSRRNIFDLDDYRMLVDLTIYVLYIFYCNELIREKKYPNPIVQEKYPGKDRNYFSTRKKIRWANLLEIVKHKNDPNRILFWQGKS